MKISKNLFLKFGMFVIALGFILNLSGCAVKPKPPFEIVSPEMGMVYGNIHIAGHEVTEVELREFGRLYIPPFVVPPRVMIFRNGDFIAENIPPGDYYISRFVSKKLIYPLVIDGTSSYQNIIRVEPGSAVYVGAYQVTDIIPGIFVKGKFNLRLARHPSERKVLKHMFEITQGTAWQSRIGRRIKSLR